MLIIIANQFIGDKLSTGGDMVAMNVAKNHKGEVSIIAPRIIEKSLCDFLKNKIYFVSSDEDNSFHSASTVLGGITTVLKYFKRSFNTTIWLIRNYRNDDLIYLSGDFICNSLPVWFLSIFKKNVRIWSNFYHRNPSPHERIGNLWLVSWGSRFLQTISLLMIKSFSEKVFALSDVGKSELLKLKFNSKKIVISGAGIEQRWLGKYKNIEKVKGRLIYVGRINVTKGAFDLIEILSYVNESDFELFMIGSGSTEDITIINKLIQKMKLIDKVKVLGFVSDQDKYRLIASSEILLLPSKEEGFGIVILEALAMNTRVICFDLPALKALFGDKLGVNMIPIGNFKEFAAKIDHVLSSKEKISLNDKVVTWDDVYRLQFNF